VSRGEYGYVYVNLADRRRFAEFLGIPTRQFTREYCTKTDGYFHLDNNGPACRFLDGPRCSVYEARPLQCRTWPFWPENMQPKAWAATARQCAGIGQGSVIPADEILAALRAQQRAETQV
jgi:Fe-S-cluster containining protein